MPGLKKTTPDQTNRSTRDGAQVWIVGGLNMITRDGVGSLRVERLAREIEVSKGSFYWFFDNINDLQECCLKYWQKTLNKAVFDEIRNLDGPVEKRLAHLVDIVMNGQLGRYDAAIRAWGLTDKNVRSVIREVDHQRLQFLVEQFLGHTPVEEWARQQAHLFYRVMIAESYLTEYPTKLEKAAYLKSLIKPFLNSALRIDKPCEQVE